jgi:phosphinothricin acetyltransferase
MRRPAPPPSDVRIRPADREDLPEITRIYNHYVRTSPCTFDLRPFSVEDREPWWSQFARTGRYRLLVAEAEDRVVGYAGSTRFRDRRAYDTTAETTVYCAPSWKGRGLGVRLYDTLLRSLCEEDLALLVAGFTLPNAASAALHRRFGFRRVGVFHRCGRKFGRYWDVQWNERPVRADGGMPSVVRRG